MSDTTRMEQELIGAATVDGGAFWEVADKIMPEHFQIPAHAAIWRALREVATAESEVVDLTALSRAVGDEVDRSYLTRVFGCYPSAAHIETLARRVLEEYTRRRLALLGEQISQEAREGRPVADVIEQAQARVFGLTAPNQDQQLLHVDDVVEATMAEIEHAYKHGRRGVPTGFQRLDNMMGNLQPGTLNILAARPGVGKTMLATNMGVNAAKQGYRVLFFSLEMSRIELGYRILGTEMGLPAPRLRAICAGDEAPPWIWAAMREAQSGLYNTPLHIIDDARLSSASITAWTRRVMANQGADLVIVDYLQKVQDRLEGKQRYLEIKATAQAAKNLARVMEVPVLLVAQLGREAEDYTRPLLKHLREGGDIEQEADAVIFLARRYDREEGEIILAKNRHGAGGIIPCRQVSRENRFEEIPEEYGGGQGF